MYDGSLEDARVKQAAVLYHHCGPWENLHKQEQYDAIQKIIDDDIEVQWKAITDAETAEKNFITYIDNYNAYVEAVSP